MWYSTILSPTLVAGEQSQGTKRKHVRAAPDRPKQKPGPPRVAMTVEEQQQVTTMVAAGWAPSRVAKAIGRSRNIVAHHLEKPETMTEVHNERANLVEIYQDRARECVIAIDADKIARSSALQLATASGICLDKSLLLSGQPTSINVVALMEVLEVIREQGDEESERQHQQRKALLSSGAGQ